jgi:hypothetical protein
MNSFYRPADLKKEQSDDSNTTGKIKRAMCGFFWVRCSGLSRKDTGFVHSVYRNSFRNSSGVITGSRYERISKATSLSGNSSGKLPFNMLSY